MTARILAIDDSDQNLQLMELCLSGEDLELVQAGSAREALDLTAAEDLDLVVLDNARPEIDAFDLCRQLRADPRTAELPVILLGDDPDDETERDQAFQSGAVDYLSKTHRKEELAVRVRAILQLRTTQRELEKENQRLNSLLQDRRDSFAELEAALAESEELLSCRSSELRCYLLLDASSGLSARTAWSRNCSA